MKDPDFDKLIKTRFELLHQKARAGDLAVWRDAPLGSLAEIIILDQFSRNMYRDAPEAFASDGLAIHLAEEAIDKGHDKEMKPEHKSFLYMPFMHSESKDMHEKAVKLFTEEGL